MLIPTVHLNGSHGPTLLDNLEIAFQSVDVAIRKLCECGPNARDYYVQGPDAAFQAQREHEARIKAMRTIRDELHATWESISDQIAAREIRRAQ